MLTLQCMLSQALLAGIRAVCWPDNTLEMRLQIWKVGDQNSPEGNSQTHEYIHNIKSNNVCHESCTHARLN